MQAKNWICLGGILGGLAVVAGAFGAHGLEKMLTESNQSATFETAVRYQMYHALALVLVGLSAERGSNKLLQFAGWCFLLGTLIFSGLLYVLIFTGMKTLGMIVPIGGSALIVGWFALAFSRGCCLPTGCCGVRDDSSGSPQ